jgi:hypothetical protein
MNKTQKALTLLAIAAFVFIVFIKPLLIPAQNPYFAPSGSLELVRFGHIEPGEVVEGYVGNFGLTLTPDGLKLLALAVVYTGLFFVLQTKRKS